MCISDCRELLKKWNFSNLKVTFLSIYTNQIGYDPNNAPIGYLSEVGSVTIQYIYLKKKQFKIITNSKAFFNNYFTIKFQ